MRLGYTEFSYGYAFTENLVRSSKAAPTGAPVFPNLVQEAQLGYDVKIDQPACPLFFQYKLPELMLSNRAKEVAKYQLAGISARFFRMSIMSQTLSDQHALLIELEKQYPDAVFYASTLLQDVSAFNAAYKSATVHERSVWFSPKDIGKLKDNDQHSVAYRDGLSYAWFCSEPRRVTAHQAGQLRPNLVHRFGQERFGSPFTMARDVREAVISRVPASLRAHQSEIEARVRSRRSAVDLPSPDLDREALIVSLLTTREIARIGLGADFLIAQPKGKADASS